MNDAIKVIGGVVGGLTLIGLFGLAISPDEDVIRARDSISQSTPEPIETAEESEPVEEPVVTWEEKDTFFECVNESGLDVEKDAVKHVTKVSGTNDESNNILDSADVYTDLKGDMFSSDGNMANIISSAFNTCYDELSENGVVTIYNQSGEILEFGSY